MVKYRVKLSNGRIIGPVSLEDIQKLHRKGIVNGQEIVHEFPHGDWISMTDIFKPNQTSASVKVDNTIFRKISDIRGDIDKEKEAEEAYLNEEAKKDFQEFEPEESKHEINYEEIKKEYEQKVNEVKGEVEEEDVPDLDATVVYKKTEIRNLKEQKTVIKPLTEAEKAELMALQREVEKGQTKTQMPNGKVESSISKQIDYDEEATQYLSVDEVPTNLIEEVQESEDLIREIEHQRVIQRRMSQLEQLPQNLPDQPTNEPKKKNKDKKKNEKKRSPVFQVLLLFVVLAAAYEILYNDQEDKVVAPQYVKIIVPKSKPAKNVTQSRQLEKEGDLFYRKGTYLDKVQAANSYRQAFEFDIESSNALSKLILTYSELLPNAKDKIISAGKIYRLIEIAEVSSKTNVNYVMGSAVFFNQLGKYESAIAKVKNYIRLKKPNSRVFSIFLKSLVKAGHLDDARKVYRILTKSKNKHQDTYISLALFEMNDDNYAEAEKWLREGALKYPASLDILLTYCQVLVYNEQFKTLANIMAAINKIGTFGSVSLYADFLKYNGILYAVQGKNQVAAKFFKEALKYQESEELRAKIAQLSIDGEKGNIVANLVLESKTIDLMTKAETALYDRDWDKAFKYAIEATDLSPDYIPAALLLSHIQAKRGYFNLAIENLEELKSTNPKRKDIGFQYVEVLIDAFKFSEAKMEMSRIANNQILKSWKYSSLIGYYHYKAKNYKQAVKFLQQSINRNPLNDIDYYRLGQIFLKIRKYKRARAVIYKAINLAPGNVYYRTMYAKILYEIQDTESAIGYLRKVEEDFKDHPKILGDIAMYYHLSGQHKIFEEYKKRLEEYRNPSIDLYHFLLESAILDEENEKIIKYAQEVAKYNPGDLESKVILGEKMIQLRMYDEALKIFTDVRDRLESYPRLLYNISKLYLLKGDQEKAEEFANMEVKNNPNLPDGYILLGDIYLDRKELSKAERSYRSAQRINPRNVDALTGLAWLEFTKNNFEIALDLYLKAVKLDPNNPILRRQLGYVYRKMGQRNMAVESFKIYLDLQPDAKDKGKIIQILRALQ